MIIDDFIKRFPPDVQETVRTIWDALGPDEKAGFLSLLSGFPTEANLMKLLVRLSTTQFRQAFGQKSRVAIVGPTNVGKSTLYNRMVANKSDLAAVSPIPGTTRANQQADAGLFTVVDTPGADAVGSAGSQQRSQALAAAEEADFLVVMFDAIQGVKKTEQDLFHELADLKKPFVVVLNKVDLVPRREQEGVVRQAAENLGLDPVQVIPVVAKDGKNLDKVLLGIAAAEPRMVAALGRALPGYRWRLAWSSIVSAASIAGAIALAPLPIIDFIPLVTTQSVMVLGIARIYDYRITAQRARELVATFGLGFLGRTLFQELSKFGGVPGWLLSAAIASSTTVAMGYAAALWFDKGERLSGEALKKLTKDLTERQLQALKSLGRRKPGGKQLQERIAESLEEPLLDGGQKNLPPENQNNH